MKSMRQNMMMKIIRSKDIETQEELLETLRSCGFSATQATVSRDIKELRLIKSSTPDGRYRYAPLSETQSEYSYEILRDIFKNSAVNVQSAQNIVVIKTLPGMASGACLALDSMPDQGIVGTLAGDDTAFVVMPDTQAANRMREKINDML